jgi:hypothetical protein
MKEEHRKEDYLNDKRILLAVIIGGIIFFGSVLTYWEREARKATIGNLNTEFTGSITSIEYDIKQYPTVTVGDSSYYIGSGYNTDHQIELGDSMIKNRGSEVYKLIKHGSKKIIACTR